MQDIQFPAHVFEDVNGTDFVKHNKKHVTEDFVTENFNLFGWRVYRPFNDTGIDLIATRYVCPNGHTKWNDASLNNKCNKCGADKIEIFRYIQVKTREVKKANSKGEVIFGYTLKSKDFRTDPRHVFLLYSDYTNDFIIIPMFDYLNIFYEYQEAGKSHFSTPSFRQGNNKLNNLKKNTQTNNWYWKTRSRKISFNNFVNVEGMKLITSPEVDLKFKEYCQKIQELKFKLFYSYSRGSGQVSKETEKLLNEHFNTFIKTNIEDIRKMRKANNEHLRKILPHELTNSIENGYFVKFKGVSLYE